MGEVGATVAQVALGDPNHATWEEGSKLVDAFKSSSIKISASMIGYPGEDYTSPATIQATGGFGDLKTRQDCLGIFRHAVNQTSELEVPILLSHAGFIPEPDEKGRAEFVDCLGGGPSQVLNARLHVHHHRFVPGKDDMIDQGP